MQKRTPTGSREIGEAIRGRRRELGLSQEYLAEILDVSYQQVQRYESGRNKLDVERLQILAQALQVPIGYFFGATEAGIIAEKPGSYLNPDEIKLLKYFRRLTDQKARNAVIEWPACYRKEEGSRRRLIKPINSPL